MVSDTARSPLSQGWSLAAAMAVKVSVPMSSACPKVLQVLCCAAWLLIGDCKCSRTMPLLASLVIEKVCMPRAVDARVGRWCVMDSCVLSD